MNFLSLSENAEPSDAEELISALTGTLSNPDMDQRPPGPEGMTPNAETFPDAWPGPGNASSMPPGMMEEGFTANERAFMWQQNQYMGEPRTTESGFISGSTTQPTSNTGHDDDMDGNYAGGSTISGSYNLDSIPHSGKHTWIPWSWH